MWIVEQSPGTKSSHLQCKCSLTARRAAKVELHVRISCGLAPTPHRMSVMCDNVIPDDAASSSMPTSLPYNLCNSYYYVIMSGDAKAKCGLDTLPLLRT